MNELLGVQLREGNPSDMSSLIQFVLLYKTLNYDGQFKENENFKYGLWGSMHLDLETSQFLLGSATTLKGSNDSFLI